MRLTLPLALLLCGGLPGCGDDDDLARPPADLQVPTDLSIPPDLAPPVDLAPYPDLVPSLGIGMQCPNGNECMAGLTCLGSRLDPQLPTEGYCTRQCNNDSDCGANAFCGPQIDKLGAVCWLRCGPNDTCALPKQVCARRLGGFADLVNRACVPGNVTAKDGSPCKTFGDCNRNQACINNPFDFPNGFCVTFGCTVGDNNTCAPGGMPVCLKSDNINLCFPTCNADGDCRVNEGYKCLQPPNTPQKICATTNPLGANCKSAKDCNGGEAPWVCIVDGNVPNGLCTVPGCDFKNDTGCPTNGHCIDVGGGTGVCLKACGGNGDCAMGLSCRQTMSGGKPVMICAP